jgi:hypothetical protein
MAVPCRRCGAVVGQPCRDPMGQCRPSIPAAEYARSGSNRSPSLTTQPRHRGRRPRRFTIARVSAVTERPADFGYLTSPPEACGMAPTATRPQLLPLGSLLPKDFERLCFRLARLNATVVDTFLAGDWAAARLCSSWPSPRISNQPNSRIVSRRSEPSSPRVESSYRSGTRPKSSVASRVVYRRPASRRRCAGVYP